MQRLDTSQADAAASAYLVLFRIIREAVNARISGLPLDCTTLSAQAVNV